MIGFQIGLRPWRQALLDGFANLLYAIDHINVNMKSICDANRIRITLLIHV